MKVIAFINEKGGTGKTTLAVNFAAFFALSLKKRVLLLDLDSQGHAGKSLGVDVRQLPFTSFELLTAPRPDIRAAIVPTRIKGLDVICANKRLANFATAVAADPQAELRLRTVLGGLTHTRYDYVFIDSPPSAGPITQNILAAADFLLIPVALTYLSFDGCAEVLASLNELKERRPEVTAEVALVVPTMYRATRLAGEIVAKLTSYFPESVSTTVLGFHVRIDEAQSYGQTIWEYEPQGKGALMLKALALELYKKVQKSAARPLPPAQSTP